MKTLILLSLLAVSSLSANEEGAYFDAPYNNLAPPVMDTNFKAKTTTRSDIESVLEFQSAVKSQGGRGTCSIFSAVAMTEALLLKHKLVDPDIDLSEEWIEFLSIAKRNAQTDGSWSYYNWNLMSKYGIPYEKDLPYIPESWKATDFGLAKTRCGHLSGSIQKTCLLGHFDPAYLSSLETQTDSVFAISKKTAGDFKSQYLDNFLAPGLNGYSWNYRVGSTSEIRSYLNNNVPLVMAIDVYYGAWNHSKSTELKIGRDMDNWHKGIVSFPEIGSIDRRRSPRQRAGHSVLIIGYDDNKVIEHTFNMIDGTQKTLSLKGVYYFKNSWGTSSFGKFFELDGVNHPGYGMISYKYANAMGTFYRLPLKGE